MGESRQSVGHEAGMTQRPRSARALRRSALGSRRRLCGLVCLTFSAVYASSAMAYQPLITDDTGTQGTDGNQVELAVFRQESKSLGVTTRTTAIPFVYTRGIADALDVYAGIGHNRITSTDASAEAHGFGNPVLGLKWRFYENDERKFSVGFKPEIQFGTSQDDEARGLGNGRTGFSGLLILTQETGFGAVHVNYGFTRANYALEPNRAALRSNLQRVSLAPVYEIGAWKLAVDAGITTNPDRSERAAMGYAELGAIWSPDKDLDLSLGAIKFLRDGEPRSFTLTAGVTWRFR